MLEQDPVIGQTIGDYKILRRLGQGGMGVVYRAAHTSSNRPVAIKMLATHLSQDQKFIKRFLREGQLSEKLGHRNIVKVYGVGRHGNNFFMVMEYIRGKTLAEILRNKGPMDIRLALEVTRDIAIALSEAHKHAIIHRDIKPANIMIDSNGIVKVMDFGLAKHTESDSTDLTSSGTVLGTPKYMSPEQFQGWELTPQTDIYSLGVILFEMLTGRVPFDADTPIGLMYQVVETPFPLPGETNPDVTSAVDDITMNMVAKEYSKRYVSAGSVARDLQVCIKEGSYSVSSSTEARDKQGESVEEGAPFQYAFETLPNIGAPKQPPAQTRPSTPFPWPLVGGLVVVALLTVGVYLTLRYFFPPEGVATLSTTVSVHAFLAQTLSFTRMFVGVVLLIAWPTSLYLSTQMATIEEDLDQEVIVAGLFLASLFYVLTWVPMDLIYMVLVVPIVVSIVLVAVLFRKHPGRAAAVWAIQMVMVTVVVLTVVAASHGIGFIKDAPGMISYAKERAAVSPRAISGRTPLRYQLTWTSSGSDWFDEAGIRTVFSVNPEPFFEGRMLFEIQDGSRTVEIREVIEDPRWDSNVREFVSTITMFDVDEIVPERPYTLTVTGPVGVEVSVSIESMLNVVAVELAPDPSPSP